MDKGDRLVPDQNDQATSATASFDRAAREALDYLRRYSGMAMWTVSRVQDEDWVLLRVDDGFYGMSDNTVLNWGDSFCSKMVRNEGPRFDPNVDATGVYCDRPVYEQVRIGAYIGIPLTLPDGSLFGTLCGIDPEPREDFPAVFRDGVTVIARLLSLIVWEEKRKIQSAREAAILLEEANRDPLTGLANRRAWDRALEEEETRLMPLAEPAAVLVIDLDDLKQINDEQGHEAGDDYLCAAAVALRTAVRESDRVARLGGDEFAILAPSCSREQGRNLAARIDRAFQRRGIRASIGVAMRRQSRTLNQAFALADERMYEQKKRRKQSAS